MQDDKESYLLLLLSDANLPTGSFVASAGLESTAAHALLHVPGPPGSDILAFLRSSVDTYARSALPFARDAHRVAAAYASGETPEPVLDAALAALTRRVRRGEPDAPAGHLPVCWGVLTGALGLTVGEHPGP